VTLYSTLKHLATPEVNVCTLEDPIEMIEASFNQVQVQADIGMGFAEGIRSLMRQDPDIIMVGEIRDLETAEMAIQAALTGHLVLSTLHTNDAPSAMTRLTDLGVPSYLLIGDGARRHGPAPGTHAVSEVQASPAPARRGRGGLERTGGAVEIEHAGAALPSGGLPRLPHDRLPGRVGIYEIMPLSNEIKRLVANGAELAKLREQAMREGMKPLRIAGAKKVAAGLTTIAEIIKVAPPMLDNGSA
jgi:general secretion pathway protein E